MIKILYFGTPEISVKSLESIYNNKNFEILGVITQPDKPSGRKMEILQSPIKVFALKNKLPIIQANSKKELYNLIKDVKADFFVVFAYGMIITKEILDLPKYGCINIHASLLPQYRGASPIQEALLNGDNETGISIMAMDEKMDHGKIFLLKRIIIEGSDNVETLSKQIAETAAEMIPYALIDIKNKLLTGIVQDESKATYCKKIEKKDGNIDFNKKVSKILNQIRAYKNWPTSYFIFKNKKITVISAEISDEKVEKGEITIINNKIIAGAKDGSLNILQLKMEGKKECSSKDFINGYKDFFAPQNL